MPSWTNCSGNEPRRDGRPIRDAASASLAADGGPDLGTLHRRASGRKSAIREVAILPRMTPANAPSTPFSRILACVAESPHLPAVVREAVRLATLCDAELEFFHVGETLDALAPAVREALPPPPNRYADARLTAQPGGRPDRVILNEAARRRCDLLFAGALQEDPMLRGVVGSVARRIARYADRSVLLSTHPSSPEAFSKTVVVAVDCSEDCGRMMPSLLEFARRASAETVHLVHEYSSYTSRLAGAETEETDSGGYGQTQNAAERLALASFLDRFDFSSLRVQTACLPGRDGAETIRYAEQHRADLLAAPGPRRSLGLWDRFFGHPVETLLQRLPCSLLLYRPTPGFAKGAAG